jgi:predicted cupin superfamily sugar epimerase
MANAKYWIQKLEMLPHPEGGFYKETFRSKLHVDAGWGQRNALTSIHYLLEGDDYSGFHKIKSPELWYYHGGGTLHIHELTAAGNYRKHVLNAQNPFAAIEPKSWFASEVANQKGFVLVSCAVAPGFDFADFEMAKKENLLVKFPNQVDVIQRLSR